jgi:MFS family permease
VPTPTSIQRTYLLLMFGNTLAASFIWGINTLFLLDAGLTNLEAFGANAFFTAGMVLFEVPTGVVADTHGRRASYLLGTVTLIVATLLYLLLWQMRGPFWGWAAGSALLGLGFTFFSGAVEAWLVDALHAAGFEGSLESVFGRGATVNGVAMLGGSVSGGYLAQVTDLGVPYLVRSVVLALTLALAFVRMRDVGFTPEGGGRTLERMCGAAPRHCWPAPWARPQPGAHRSARPLRVGRRPGGRVGAPVGHPGSDPAGLPQRADPVPPARHHPLLRLPDGLERRRRDPAGPGPGC